MLASLFNWYNGKVKKVLNEKGRRVLIEWNGMKIVLELRMLGDQSIDWQLLSGIQKIPPKAHGDIISKSKYERKLTYIGKIR